MLLTSVAGVVVEIAESLSKSAEFVSDFSFSSFAGKAVLRELSMKRSASSTTICSDELTDIIILLSSNLLKMLRCGASNLRAEEQHKWNNNTEKKNARVRLERLVEVIS